MNAIYISKYRAKCSKTSSVSPFQFCQSLYYSLTQHTEHRHCYRHCYTNKNQEKSELNQNRPSLKYTQRTWVRGTQGPGGRSTHNTRDLFVAIIIVRVASKWRPPIQHLLLFLHSLSSLWELRGESHPDLTPLSSSRSPKPSTFSFLEFLVNQI